MAAALAVLAWLLRPAVAPLTGDPVYHAAPAGQRVLALALVPVFVLVLGAVGVAVDRVLLHGVAWSLAGALANTGEMVATGSVADYIHVGDHTVISPGDAYLAVGVAVLTLGALRIVVRGLLSAARGPRRHAAPARSGPA